MPQAPKFSEVFYERFGHDVVDELLDWLNKMDMNSQASLRELNELNFARFDAKLELRIGEVRSEMRAMAADLKVAFAEQAVTQMRWMIGMWAAVMLAIIGLWIRK